MSPPVVYLTTKTSVRGKDVSVTDAAASAYAFLGIPYAEPPVGEQRFLPPKAVTLWEGERDCTDYGPMCIQSDMGYSALAERYRTFPSPDVMHAEQSEDCLSLNVWTPTLAENRALPVMVWIHGGCFTLGASMYYDLSAMAALNDVVCVSMNYRNGIFGFLTTGDDVIPGNAGLLDQLEALKWIKQYVAKFGGNPENVTLFGNSAGGMSASLHVVSGLARGLFRRVICQSGMANSAYVVRTQSQELQSLLPGLKQLGYAGSCSTDMLKFLQSKSTQELLTAFPRYFKVVIDGYYLTDYPYNLFRREDYVGIDIITGYCTHESVFMTDIIRDPIITGRPDQGTLSDFLKQAAGYGFSDNKEQLVDAMKHVYFKQEILDDNDAIFRSLMQLYTDMVFVGPVHEFARDCCKSASTYVYALTHRPSYSLNESWVTSDHIDEVPYVMGYPFLTGDRAPRVNFTEAERKFSRAVMAYWTNFAKTGNPNGEGLLLWPEFSSERREYMRLQPSPEVVANYNPEKMDFWHRTIPQLDTGRHYSKN